MLTVFGKSGLPYFADFHDFFSCFTFGIGSGASTKLVEGLATAGKGSAEFIKEGERLQPKVSHHY